MKIVFTDGSSRGNPGPGGWGAIIVDVQDENNSKSNSVTEMGGFEDHTTNNRMEITAAIKALSRLGDDEQITIHTDSSYLINGITKWINGWRRNNWQTKLKEDVLNKDLWQELYGLAANKKINWKYVGGHVGVAGNERCDEIATGFALGKKIDLYNGSIVDYEIKNILNTDHDVSLHDVKKKSGSRSKAPAYSYVSYVDGKIEIHKSWESCEKRVKGAKGARFKKALSASEETEIIQSFTKVAP